MSQQTKNSLKPAGLADDANQGGEKTTLPAFNPGEISRLCQFKTEDNEHGRRVSFVIPDKFIPKQIFQIFANTYCAGDIKKLGCTHDDFYGSDQDKARSISFEIHFQLASLRHCDIEQVLQQIMITSRAEKAGKQSWQKLVQEAISKNEGPHSRPWRKYYVPKWQMALAGLFYEDTNGWFDHNHSRITEGITIICGYADFFRMDNQSISIYQSGYDSDRYPFRPDAPVGYAPALRGRNDI